MQALNELITAAVQLAGADDLASHNARLWQMEGGRACPLGWGGCSQPVYVDVKTGEHDYGEPGGPGHADCVRNCKHGMQQQPEDDEDWERAKNATAKEPSGFLRKPSRQPKTGRPLSRLPATATKFGRP